MPRRIRLTYGLNSLTGQLTHCFPGRLPRDISVGAAPLVSLYVNQLMDQREPLREMSDRGQRGRKKRVNECSGLLTS